MEEVEPKAIVMVGTKSDLYESDTVDLSGTSSFEFLEAAKSFEGQSKITYSEMLERAKTIGANALVITSAMSGKGVVPVAGSMADKLGTKPQYLIDVLEDIATQLAQQATS